MKELICGSWLKDMSVHGDLKIVFDNVDQMENDPDFAAMFDYRKGIFLIGMLVKSVREIMAGGGVEQDDSLDLKIMMVNLFGLSYLYNGEMYLHEVQCINGDFKIPKLLVSKRTVINFKNTRILFKDMFQQDLCHIQFTEWCLYGFK